MISYQIFFSPSRYTEQIFLEKLMKVQEQGCVYSDHSASASYLQSWHV